MSEEMVHREEPVAGGKREVVFVKYGNRKLYNTATSAYASMVDLFDAAAASSASGAVVRVTSDVDGGDVTLATVCRALYEKVKSMDQTRVGLSSSDVVALFVKVKET